MKPGALAKVAEKDARLAWLLTTAGIENKDHLQLFYEFVTNKGLGKRTAEGAGACGKGPKRRSGAAEPESSGAGAPGFAELKAEGEAAAQPPVAAALADPVAEQSAEGPLQQETCHAPAVPRVLRRRLSERVRLQGAPRRRNGQTCQARLCGGQ